MRRSVATPCPVVASQNRIIDDTYAEDTTANLDYTTAFHASFRNVRPKRGQITRRGPTNFAIHEDTDVTGGPSVGQTSEQPPRLAHPAKRVTAQQKREEGSERATNQVSEAIKWQRVQDVRARRPAIAPKRVSTSITALPDELIEERKALVEEQRITVERPARRKTLYIPSDDTTQPTMWMGIFSPIKHEIDHTQRGNDRNQTEELTGIAAQMAEKRRRRISVQPTKAKRLPLHSTAGQGQAYEAPDRAGAPTGKENLPPGQAQNVKQLPPIAIEEPRKNQKIDRDLQRQKFIAQARTEKRSNMSKQAGSASPEVCTLYEIGRNKQDTNVERSKRTAWNAGPRAIVKEERTSKKQRHVAGSSPNGPQSSQSLPTIVPSRFVQPSLQKPPPYLPHAPIIEHIEHPQLYEEDWLDHQETAITQLLNSILSQAQGGDTQNLSREGARATLLERYNSQDIRLMYSRVQAASLYGALSPTHEAIIQIQNLVNDVGRRKLFLKFWVHNYEAEMLKVALEVVSGRQLDTPVQRRSAGNSPSNGLKRSTLASFIESFILRHEDSQFKAAGSGTTGDLGSKTILKSLMLLKTLDLLKEDGDGLSRTLLFRKNASFKSSVMAVQTLIQMLNPAVGDPIRALRQLGYVVLHQQEPTDELACRIDNIAVDLRDGVCLTRLVEFLLYRSRSTQWGSATQPVNDTVTMTDGHIISLLAHEDHPLSRHLKVPCLSRAAKMWNVQIALGALRNVKNVESLIEDILPEDIVDGYREKTIKLLWTIAGRWGLTGFIDRDDLRKEIRRLNRRTVSNDCFEVEDDVTSQQLESERLLKKWTDTVASSRGLEVRNFTTSFSDGRIFEAILDEYEPYLVKWEGIKKAPLYERLARLGCSKQFSDLFSSNSGQMHIFGKDFVLAALAFLCSRVVGPSKLCRSAIRIQRCWRRHWDGVQRARRMVKRDLAEACAASVCLKLGQVESDKILTHADLGDMTTEATARSEIDEDIWLSL